MRSILDIATLRQESHQDFWQLQAAKIRVEWTLTRDQPLRMQVQQG